MKPFAVVLVSLGLPFTAFAADYKVDVARLAASIGTRRVSTDV
jgi:hypothetical protein